MHSWIGMGVHPYTKCQKNLLKVPSVQLNPGTEAADFSKNYFASAEPPLAGFVFLGLNV